MPPGHWVATSGSDAIARGRLAQAGLPVPEVLISTEMVACGKPDPEVYARAAAALGVDAAACLARCDNRCGTAYDEAMAQGECSAGRIGGSPVCGGQ